MSAFYWRSVARQMGSGRRLSTMTVPKMKPMSPATAAGMSGHHGRKPRESKAEFTPIAVVFGLVVVALCIGAHTAKQQLVHSPSVWVSKKKRESIPEVEMRGRGQPLRRQVLPPEGGSHPRLGRRPIRHVRPFLHATSYGELEVCWG